MAYPAEQFADSEREVLGRYFTNIDRPVFCLTGLPETVKGALFARYSRYGGTLRRLFLDEFAADLPEFGGGFAAEGARAARLYENVFLGFGDDSVAQLGGAHLACEWVSNIVTKLLQRGRLAAYLEQSTRYIPYDASMPGGGYRYWRDDSLGPQYERTMDSLFATYSELLSLVERFVSDHYPPQPNEPEGAHRRAVRAKALDLVRGILPCASLSHVGIFASGQAYEQLVLRLFASPLPEARELAAMMLEELKQVIPSFLARVERPDRGGRWIDYLKDRGAAADRSVRRLGLDRRSDATGPSVRLLEVQGCEQRLLAALLFEAANVSEDEALQTVGSLSPAERSALLQQLCGERANRRHRPGRGFEAVRYRFEIVSDYGAFRDLQRHRMLTVQWQTLTPDLGAEVPAELSQAGAADAYERALERSRAEYERLRAIGRFDVASYALCLAYRIRYTLDLNAREAMHVIELRSQREGHSTYRAIAHELHGHIKQVHPAIADCMTHVDSDTDDRLERSLAELRLARREGVRT